MAAIYPDGANQLNTTVHGNMKTTPYEVVFGQPPRQGIFPGIKGPSVVEEDIDDIVMKDEQFNVFQDQCSSIGQENFTLVFLETKIDRKVM